ncbi:MAG: cupin domain-containing protein [Chloroflexota bacterium]|nr:cupin domain-containing protein [Chloroflexota bacterium]
MARQYDRIKELAKTADARGRTGPVIMHTKDLEPGRDGTAGDSALISEPEVLGSLVQTMAMALNVIPPKQATGRHRHNSEHLLYVLQGHGRTEVEGSIYEWGEGDVIATPMRAWHQHFNDDPEIPVRYIGINNTPLLRAMSLIGREDG